MTDLWRLPAADLAARASGAERDPEIADAAARARDRRRPRGTGRAGKARVLVMTRADGLRRSGAREHGEVRRPRISRRFSGWGGRGSGKFLKVQERREVDMGPNGEPSERAMKAGPYAMQRHQRHDGWTRKEFTTTTKKIVPNG